MTDPGVGGVLAIRRFDRGRLELRASALAISWLLGVQIMRALHVSVTRMRGPARGGLLGPRRGAFFSRLLRWCYDLVAIPRKQSLETPVFASLSH